MITGPANFGEPKRHRSKDERDAIVAMKPTHSAAEVAKKFGTTKNAVIGIWDRADAAPIPKKEFRRRCSSKERA